jgi:hypothetical protein
MVVKVAKGAHYKQQAKTIRLSTLLHPTPKPHPPPNHLTISPSHYILKSNLKHSKPSISTALYGATNQKVQKKK